MHAVNPFETAMTQLSRAAAKLPKKEAEKLLTLLSSSTNFEYNDSGRHG